MALHVQYIVCDIMGLGDDAEFSIINEHTHSPNSRGGFINKVDNTAAKHETGKYGEQSSNT